MIAAVFASKFQATKGRISQFLYCCGLLIGGALVPPPAAGFTIEDTDARKAIIDVRKLQQQQATQSEQQLANLEQKLKAEIKANSDSSQADNANLRRLLLTQQANTDAQQKEIAQSNGQIESLENQNRQLEKKLLELEARSRELDEQVRHLLKQQEAQTQSQKSPPVQAPTPPAPANAQVKIPINGREELVSADDVQAYEAAVQEFRKKNFTASAANLGAFLKRAPQSPLAANAKFWQGQALYFAKDYRNAIAILREITPPENSSFPQAADALLIVSSSFLELKENNNAKASLKSIIKNYPKSEAAATAQKRLTRMK